MALGYWLVLGCYRLAQRVFPRELWDVNETTNLSFADRCQYWHHRFFALTDAVLKAQSLAIRTDSAMFWRILMGALLVSILHLPQCPKFALGKILKIHII